MPTQGGVRVLVTRDTMNQVAQQLMCWASATGDQQLIEYRTDGNLPYFYIPSGVCGGAGPLTLTPGGDAITCPTSGNATLVEPVDANVSGVNPNTCQTIEEPGGLAGSGSPTATTIPVQWNAPDGPPPTGYRLAWRKDGTTGAWSYKIVPGIQRVATITGLTANTAYDIKVQALHDTYSSAFTADTTISTTA
ncbi:fibronectin type III domain-containing protein [Streptomyces longwoodensis]|uniref:fibronectin type III domain-containing protein n=1 Tax=Streptomyces longwoodensis TaxID=68231 RepID=UPI0036F4E5EF